MDSISLSYSLPRLSPPVSPFAGGTFVQERMFPEKKKASISAGHFPYLKKKKSI